MKGIKWEEKRKRWWKKEDGRVNGDDVIEGKSVKWKLGMNKKEEKERNKGKSEEKEGRKDGKLKKKKG